MLKTGILLIHEIASTLLMLFGCTQYSEVNDSGDLRELEEGDI